MPNYRHLLLATLLCLCMPEIAQSQIRITVKKPKIKISKPKIRVPSPETIVKNVAAATKKATSDVVNTSGKAVHDGVVAVGVAGNQTAQAITKGVNDAIGEAKRVPGHAVELGDALGAVVESYAQSTEKEIAGFEKRISEGKILDALFHSAIAPLKADEEAAFQATQKSGWVNSAGALAASAYGGWGGSAAYAAWQTYRTTKDPELAIRAGVIAGLTAAATKSVSGIDGTATPDLIKKTVLAGAVSGLSIAASGGDDDAIRDGIILGGSMVLIQEGYKSYTKVDLDARGAEGLPYCIAQNDASCKELANAFHFNNETNRWEYDPSKLDPRRPHVGIQAIVDENGNICKLDNNGNKIILKAGDVKWNLASDKSIIMTGAARIPGFNAMAIFHDKWVCDWRMGRVGTVATIFPAIVITYYGTTAPLMNAVTEQVIATAGDNTRDNGTVPGPAHNREPTASALKNDTTQLEQPMSSEDSASLSIMWAFQEFQKTIPESGLDLGKGSIQRAFEDYQSSLSVKTDSIISKNRNLEKLAFDAVEPKPGFRWKRPADSSAFETEQIKGLAAQKDGTLVPMPGWEWATPEDPLDMKVRPVQGLAVLANGEFRPLDGWDWQNPDDENDLSVKKLK